jgi:ABC-type transport system involved in multi-copper enzyme maturation permease subunit
MGLRRFEKLISLKNKMIIGLIVIIYLWTLAFYVMLGDSEDYPCRDFLDGYQSCVPLNYYGDLGSQVGLRIFIISLAAIASGGMIGNDMANKSLHLYLSRPISRIDYLIARFIPVFLLLLLVTAVPNLMVAAAMWSDGGLKTEWITDHKWLIVNIFVQGIFYSAAYSIIGLTFSTALKKESNASGAFFLFVYGTSIIAETFFSVLTAFDINGSDGVLLLSISHVLDMISYAIFDAKYYVMAFAFPWEVDVSDPEVGAVFTFVFAGCCGFMYWMILQMESNK